MKKIITLLFAAGLMTSAFSQTAEESRRVILGKQGGSTTQKSGGTIFGSKSGSSTTSREEEIAKVDTSVAQVNAKLVEITPVSLNHFTHYIDLQGRIDAENIAYVTPRGQGGQVKEIYVKQGDYVKNGQLLMKLDNAVVKQQIDQLKVQLNLAVIARFRLEGMMLAFNQDIFPSSKFNLGELHKALIEHFLFGVASSKGYKLIVKYQQERIKINQ